MTSKTYAATMKRQDGSVLVEVPDFPGVIGAGTVAAGAVFAARTALAARLAGAPLPDPVRVPADGDVSITITQSA